MTVTFRTAISKCRLYKDETNLFLHYRLARDQSGYNFDFRLLYKVLPKETAVVRFGGIKNEGKLNSSCYTWDSNNWWVKSSSNHFAINFPNQNDCKDAIQS